MSINQDLSLGSVLGTGLRQRVRTGVLTTSAQSVFPAQQAGSARASVDDLAAQLGLVVLGISATC